MFNKVYPWKSLKMRTISYCESDQEWDTCALKDEFSNQCECEEGKFQIRRAGWSYSFNCPLNMLNVPGTVWGSRFRNVWNPDPALKKTASSSSTGHLMTSRREIPPCEYYGTYLGKTLISCQRGAEFQREKGERQF